MKRRRPKKSHRLKNRDISGLDRNIINAAVALLIAEFLEKEIIKQIHKVVKQEQKTEIVAGPNVIGDIK